MMRKYGLTSKHWGSDDLVRDASEVAGVDLSEFFSRYIGKRKTLPVRACLEDAGFDAALNYAGSVHYGTRTAPNQSALHSRRLLDQSSR